MAPVVHTVGSVMATAPGSGPINSKVGGALPDKTSLKIAAGSEIAFDPYPGGLVLVTEKTDTTIDSLEFVRSGEQVQKRAATMRLDAGRLFFAIAKFKTNVTKFVVTTPDRAVAARAKPEKPAGVDVAGMVEVRGKSLLITVLSGAADLSGPGKGLMEINAGSMFSSDGATSRLLDMVSGKISFFDAAGDLVESRAANAAELLAGRTNFQSALGIAQQAISVGSLDGGMIAAITRTLVQVNSSLASNGLDALTATAVGAAKSGFGGATYQLPGMDGAQTVNPANISGVVRSGER